MTATMARQGGRIQLEQSNIWLALNQANMVKSSFLRSIIEETQNPIKQPLAEVREEKK
jgi:hypothetical protein